MLSTWTENIDHSSITMSCSPIPSFWQMSLFFSHIISRNRSPLIHPGEPSHHLQLRYQQSHPSLWPKSSVPFPVKFMSKPFCFVHSGSYEQLIIAPPSPPHEWRPVSFINLPCLKLEPRRFSCYNRNLHYVKTESPVTLQKLMRPSIFFFLFWKKQKGSELQHAQR